MIKKIITCMIGTIAFYACNTDQSKTNETDEPGEGKNFSGQITDLAEVEKISLRPNVLQDSIKSYGPPVDSISLKKFCPPVADQNYGTCYSYASAYAARTILYNVTIGDSVTPGNNCFSPGFVQRMVFGSKLRKCRNKGTDTHYACRLMEENGCLKLIDYPDDCSSTGITEDMYKEAAKYKIKAARLYKVCASNTEKVQQIKNSLQAKKPVVICIKNADGFYAKTGNPELWEPNQLDRKQIDCGDSNHAICVIGYNNKKFGGAFEVMNSYSTNWKGDGFVWVRYDDFVSYAAYAIELSNP